MAGASSGSGTSSSTGPRQPPSCPAGSQRPTGAARPCAGPGAPGPRGANKTPWTIDTSGLRLECRPAAGGQVGPRSRTTRRHGAGSTGPSARWPRRSSARRSCCRCSATPAARRCSPPVQARGSRTLTPPSPPSPGRDGTPRRRGWRIGRCAGSSTTSGRWSDANVAAGTATTGSSSIRRRTATDRRRGRSTTDLPPLLDDLAALLGPRPGLVVLSAHTPGYDGERLAALCRDAFGAGAASGELRLIARSGNVLRLGGWARSPER